MSTPHGSYDEKQPAIAAPALDTAALRVVGDEGCRLVDGAACSLVVLRRCQMSGYEAEDVLFDRVLGEHANLSQNTLSLVQMLDCRWQTCDIANSAFAKTHLRRVEFVGCRMVGVALTEADVQDTLLHRCQADMSRFWECRFKAVRFARCSLRQASFAGSRLAGVVFRDCDLSQADFRGARLQGADLRGSSLEGVQAEVADLRGALIDVGQAVQLARVFGLVVE